MSIWSADQQAENKRAGFIEDDGEDVIVCSHEHLREFEELLF